MLRSLGRRKWAFAALALGALTMSLVAACDEDDGEDRPGTVSVISDGGSASASGSVSGSVSGVSGSVSGATGSASGTGAGEAANGYSPVSNVAAHFDFSLDIRDMRALMQPATEGQPVDWAAVLAIYEKGANATRSDGTLRPIGSLPDEDVHAVFPNGAAAYGSPTFLDDRIRTGLAGTGRGEVLSDNGRRQIVDKTLQSIVYAKALQELGAAATRIGEGNTADADGAPHAVDESWAILAGRPNDEGVLAYSLLATATSREANFGLDGTIRDPLEQAHIAAQAAARAGDAEAYAVAHEEIRGLLNAIFYLATLHYANELQHDETPADREVHLAEGWAFFQTIRADVAAASPETAELIEAAFNASPDAPFEQTEAIYEALNAPAVLAQLGIPDAVVTTEPATE